MENITLEVQNLRKTIGNKEIIKGISFNLNKGEVFGFLGPNGAGKTTTIRMMVGLIRPTGGTIKICGFNIQTHFYKAIKNLGCIVENPELYPYLSGWDNLLHFVRMLEGIGEERIKEVTELVGLTERIHDKVKTYSLGMRQRLGIAQALLGKPKVLILDEPTNGLDPRGIREMREFIRYLAEKEGLSVLVSSHLLSEIQLLCDRVAIISKGTIIRIDEVTHLLSNQERVVWRFQPYENGREILTSLTNIIENEDGTILTEFDEKKIPEWNKTLVKGGIKISEMARKSPVLEDLFLELTGGDTIE